MRGGIVGIFLLGMGLGAASALAQGAVGRGAGDTGVSIAAPDEAAFRDWIRAFRPRALAQGISEETFDAAFEGIRLNLKTIERDRTQNEFTRTIWDYLDTAVSEERVRLGREALARHRALFDRIEDRYGVEAEVVAAIWGLESAYGAFRGSLPVIESLATLAYEGRRARFFEAELIAALKILQAGHVRPEEFTGSWAGASGHTQFMPSSFWTVAVDWTGDGRRDLWGDDPSDALASTAAYLQRHGWQRGLPWGMEVTLPADFPWDQSGERIRKPVADWTALGVRDADGGVIGVEAPASVLLPAGHEGAAFLIFANFRAIEAYNTADAYVIAVGNLSDRLRGGPAIRHGWPRQDRALTFDEKKELQRLLLGLGHDPKGVDGIMGPNTIEAVRGFQRAEGLVPDGYAPPRLLERLRQVAGAAGKAPASAPAETPADASGGGAGNAPADSPG